MGKRVDHDATQEVSASMLVPPAKPPALGTTSKNDASMWMSAPVSADDFVGAAKKKKPAASRGRGLVIGATVIGLLGVGGAGAYYAFLSKPAAQSSTPAPAPTTAQPAAAPATADAAVAEAPADDAGVAAVATAADAGAEVQATAGALQVDAISAADPAVKKTTKKRPAKKKAVKKKTASKRR